MINQGSKKLRQHSNYILLLAEHDGVGALLGPGELGEDDAGHAGLDHHTHDALQSLINTYQRSLVGRKMLTIKLNDGIDWLCLDALEDDGLWTLLCCLARSVPDSVLRLHREQERRRKILW